ncbi:MAG: hypothetical protein P9L99_13675 [Candidatus Lernaella stagnicola]|nr:hypothetical protein [Candidatus Lernaella stagnicola]
MFSFLSRHIWGGFSVVLVGLFLSFAYGCATPDEETATPQNEFMIIETDEVFDLDVGPPVPIEPVRRITAATGAEAKGIEIERIAGGIPGYLGFSLLRDRRGFWHLVYARAGRLVHRWQVPSGGFVETEAFGSVYVVTAALDVTGAVHAAYIDDRNSRLVYATNRSGQWVAEELPVEDVYSYGFAIGVDDKGAVHIGYQYYVGPSLRRIEYAVKRGGAWSMQTLVTTNEIPGPHWFALDAKGRIHFLFFRNGRLKYANNVFGKWIGQLVPIDSASGGCALAVDNANRPRLFCADDHQAYDIRRFGMGWQIDNVLNASNAVGPRALRIGPDGVAHVAYAMSGSLYYASDRGGEWTSEFIVNDYGRAVEIGLEIDGDPFIAATFSLSGTLYGFTRSGPSWPMVVLDPGGYVESDVSVAVDSEGYSHVLFYDYGTNSLNYARGRSGAWEMEIVNLVNSGGRYHAIVLDSGGRPHVAFQEGISYSQNYASYARRDAGVWDIQRVEPDNTDSGYNIALALDGQDQPNLTFVDDYPEYFKYARLNGDEWVVESYDTSYYAGVGCAIAIDWLGRPHVAYMETSYNLYHGVRNWWNWSTQPLTPHATGGDVDLIIDEDGQPRVFNTSYSNGGLYESRKTNLGWQYGAVDVGGAVNYSLAATRGPNGAPHLVYQTFDDDTNMTGLRYAYESGGEWQLTDIDAVAVGTVDVAIDTAGYVYAVYIAYNAVWHARFPAGNAGDAANNPGSPDDEVREQETLGVAGDLDQAGAAGGAAALDPEPVATTDSDPARAAEFALAGQSDEIGLVTFQEIDGGSPGELETRLVRCPNGETSVFANRGSFLYWYPVDGAPGDEELIAFNAPEFDAVCDTNNVIHLIHYDGVEEDLVYRKRQDGVWSSQVLLSEGDVGRAPSIVVDSTGGPHVIQYDVSGRDIKHGTNASGEWVWESVLGTEATWTALAIDATGYLHAVVDKKVYGYLYYATNKSGAWQSTALSTSGAGYSFTPGGIVVDSAGFAHVTYGWIYGSGLPTIRYGTNATGSWITTSLGYYRDPDPAIALDGAGRPVIAFNETDHLTFATKTDGTWAYETIDPDHGGNRANLEYDGHWYVSYFDSLAHNLRYADDAGGDWRFAALDESGMVERSLPVAMGFDGVEEIHALYYKKPEWELTHATNRGGQWTSTPVASVGADTSGANALAFDAEGGVHATFYEVDEDALYYGRYEDGVWSTELIEPWGGIDSALLVDGDGNVHIAYTDAANEHVRYAGNSTGSWRRRIIDGLAGGDLSIGQDAAGTLHVLYWDYALFHAAGNGNSWTTEIVDDELLAGKSNRLIIAPDGTLHAFYFAEVSDTLRHATKAGGEWMIEDVYATSDNSAPLSVWREPSGAFVITYHGETYGQGIYLVTNRYGAWERYSIFLSHNSYQPLVFETPSGTVHFLHVGADVLWHNYFNWTE